MISKLVLALVVAAATVQEAQAGQDLRLLNDECVGADGENVDCDPIEDQIMDAEPEETPAKQKAFETAQVPSDHMYFKSPTYKAKTRQEKMAELWNELVPNPETNDVEPKEYPWEQFPRFFSQKGNGSFCQSSDESKKKRAKTVHTQGLVAQVEWIPLTTKYTGMYSETTNEVIMRLSETQMLTEESTGLHPSLALKFLVDGYRSANLLASVGMHPTNSWDFLDKNNVLKNRLEPFDQTPDGPDWTRVQTVQKKMIEGSRHPFATGVSIIGTQNADGTRIHRKDVNVPYELHYKSALPDDQNFVNAVNRMEWYKHLKEIPEGSDLFTVYAKSSHHECEGYEYEPIATIRLKTKLYTSVSGDERLYFQHRRVTGERRFWDVCSRQKAEDMEFVKNATTVWGHGPREIYDEWPRDREEAEDEYLEQIMENGCPFAWLLGQ